MNNSLYSYTNGNGDSYIHVQCSVFPVSIIHKIKAIKSTMEVVESTQNIIDLRK